MALYIHCVDGSGAAGQGQVSRTSIPGGLDFAGDFSLPDYGESTIELVAKPVTGYYLERWVVNGVVQQTGDGVRVDRSLRITLPVADVGDTTIYAVFVSRARRSLESVYLQWPKAFREADESGHLEDYSLLLEAGLDALLEAAERFRLAPWFLEAGFVRAHFEQCGQARLAELLTDAEVLKVGPWLVRLLKLKGHANGLYLLLRLLYPERSIVLTQRRQEVFRFYGTGLQPQDSGGKPEDFPRTFAPGHPIWRTYGVGSGQTTYLLDIGATVEELRAGLGVRITRLASFFVPFYVTVKVVASGSLAHNEDGYVSVYGRTHEDHPGPVDTSSVE